MKAPRPNPARPGTMLIPLTRGYFAVVDEADAASVSTRSWHVRKGDNQAVYAITNGRRSDGARTTIELHVFLWRSWGRPATPQIDHENRDGLDCTQDNLRAATETQNRRNAPLRRDSTSGLKGVGRHKGRWRARITVDGIQRHLGYFDEPSEAAAAYDRAAVAFHGEFACPNNLQEGAEP